MLPGRRYSSLKLSGISYTSNYKSDLSGGSLPFFCHQKEVHSIGTSLPCISDARIIKRRGQSIIDDLQSQFCVQGRCVFPLFLQRSTGSFDGKGKYEIIWEVKTATATAWGFESDCHQTAVEPRCRWQVILSGGPLWWWDERGLGSYIYSE